MASPAGGGRIQNTGVKTHLTPDLPFLLEVTIQYSPGLTMPPA
jgi:hypothetical protein